MYIVLYCTTGSKLEGRQARRVWRGAGVHAGREGERGGHYNFFDVARKLGFRVWGLGLGFED